MVSGEELLTGVTCDIVYVARLVALSICVLIPADVRWLL